jgi:hypothetical protein
MMKGEIMRGFARILAVVALSLLAASCTKDNFSAVAKKEDMMIAAGFRFLPANTPERQAFFRQLPPHRFLKEIKGDKLIYIYPDPKVCVCLYVGNEKAYSAYRKMMFDRNLADEQAMTAQALNDFSWNWTAWADGFPYGWPYTDSIYNY